ncbi:glycosyltransferase family 2 protein [Stieleria sp. ICT_E10.1]|uniref:glycosyltransferase family 2 protein n=1 Tax=Stieleria sedimenti TaxID=2976331 RepID=UPI00217F406C|nr:glycosyltransferase family 2 protein [Stieleria sedimenti]MCS7465478.1 glycosyltransferase family 2 protein [Stieleria sedimenti]
MQLFPVLFTIFNRPEQTRQTFDAIRLAQPHRLYVAADGPRPDRHDDLAACEATRQILDEVDWDCEVFTLYRDQNLGCKRAMAEGISWFFEHEPAGIVIEDDCVADPTFFRLCSELLERYADDRRIGMISGINHYQVQSNREDSYHFSKLGRIWGWATWRDRWALYDDTLDAYAGKLNELRRSIGQTERYRQMFFAILDADQCGSISTWDCYWDLALHANDLLTVRPKCNLVSNVGFGDGATHTGGKAQQHILQRGSLEFPLHHPATVQHDRHADRIHEQRLYPNSWIRRLARTLGARKMLKKIRGIFASTA